jgi:hypothetical protein
VTSLISGLLLVTVVLAIWVSMFFGFHRQDVLYLSSAAYFLLLPAIVIVAVIASAFVQVKRVTRGTADGKELVQHQLEPVRWGLIVALRAIGFGLLITLGAYYCTGMAVSYTSRTPIHIEGVPARLFAPQLGSHICRRFAVVTLSQVADSYICIERTLGSAHAKLSSLGGLNRGMATIDGRSGFFGAVADTVSISQAATR